MDKGKEVQDDNIDSAENDNGHSVENDNGVKHPFIGMAFDSEEAAYTYYNTYGRQVGFSVRKHTTRLDKDKKLIGRKFCCSKEGLNLPKKSNVLSYSSKRCNCSAKMEIKRVEEGEWKVIKFEPEHNHKVTTPTKSHMLRSQKKISREAVNLITKLNDCGMNPSKIFSVFANEAEGYENVSFSEDDVRRKVREFSKRTYGNDANKVLEYFEKKQEENPSFFYSIQADEGGQMGNCFWVDAKSRVDFQHFGDVIVFDTTYKTNKYLMSFAPFTGVNNHRQSILFGCALLVDECEASFEWLFRKWLQAVGFPPRAIITDQDLAMTKAIDNVTIVIVMGTMHVFVLNQRKSRKVYQHPLKENDIEDLVQIMSATCSTLLRDELINRKRALVE